MTICQKCGDKGYGELLIYCACCQVSAEHRYCLDILPKTKQELVIWICNECVQNVSYIWPKPEKVQVEVDTEDNDARSRRE